MAWITYALIAAVGISLLPLFCDALSTVAPIGRAGNKLLSFALVGILYSLSGSAIVIYTLYFLPFYYSFLPLAHCFCLTVIAAWLWLNLNITYTVTLFSSPSIGTNSIDSSDEKVDSNQQLRECTKCHRPKRQLTHHCNICTKCIPFMDHHCPLIANCISHGRRGNYNMFVLFLIYICLCVGFTALVTGVAFFAALRQPITPAAHIALIALGSLRLLFIPSIIAIVPCAILLSFHLLLIVTKRSTLMLARDWGDLTSGTGSLSQFLLGADASSSASSFSTTTSSSSATIHKDHAPPFSLLNFPATTLLAVILCPYLIHTPFVDHVQDY